MRKLQQTLMALSMSAAIVGSLALPMFSRAQAPPPLSEEDFRLRDIGGELGLGTRDIRLTVARLIRGLMTLLGIVAVVIVLIGGFQWMTAGGNEENVKKAQKRIIQGVIGLLIVVTAFAITQFFIQQILAAARAQ